jgi:hypothetical protein
MERRVKRIDIAAAAFFMAQALTTGVPVARANDSIAETALGGLTFVKSDAISLDSEDLFISRDRVRVKYRFTNTTDAPIDALVAFPLPPIPPGNEAGEEEAVYWSDAHTTLKFKTLVDGQPLDLDIIEQAMLQGRDITARLAALGVPINRFAPGFDKAIAALSATEREKLVVEKAIVNSGGDDWAGLWTLRTTITRRQTFPAQKTIVVEHEYTPLAGGAVGPSAQYAGQPNYFSDIRAKYCIDDDWLRAFDRTLPTKDKRSNTSEIFIGYVLRTGANWKGPIKDFHLVVDKGRADSLVSFCADGVKKISPTQFEVRYSNFTPTKDLNVLILDWPTGR